MSASARPLRIAALVSTYPPYRAGQGNVCAAQSAELARRGHDVTVFTAANRSPGHEPGPPAVERQRALLALGNAPLLPRLAWLRGYDVIHLHQPFIFGAELSVLGALASRTPVVSSFHNELRADGIKGALFRVYNATAMRLALRLSRRIAVLSTDHAQAVAPLAAHLRRRPEAIDEVPNGVDPVRFSPGKAPAVRRRHGIGEDALVALVCASLDHAHGYKRVDLAIAATAALADEHDVHLLVVGDGPLRGGLSAMAVELGIANRVTFAGELDADLPDYYRAADVLVLPSEWEAFGLVQIEAMASGKPVIVTSVAGARVVSIDREHGLHVRPGDGADLERAMREIATMDPSVRAAMGERGRRRVLERYTWERSTDALEQSLLRAVGAADRVTISYVLVAFNSAPALRASLPALVRELLPGDQVVVVDNGSADESVAVVRDLCPAARVVEGGGNVGFAGGANAGSALAQGDLIVFLNPDAVVAPGFGAAIRRPLAERRGWDAWMGLVTARAGELINSSGNVVHFTGIAWAGQAGTAVRDADLTPHEVAFLSGACLAVPRAVWRRLGGFPERYFMYQEDLDFSLRVRLSGGRVGIEPSARVDHDYEFHKGAAKWRHLERNRLSTITRVYPGGLLALVLPALLATELALLGVSFSNGWGREKLRANAQWLRELPSLIRQRRVIQRERRISAAEFARWLTPELSSSYLGPTAQVGVVRLGLRAYWRCVLLFLRAR